LIVRYRDSLEAHGCPGARKEDEARTYYRFMCDVDIVNNKAAILGLFDIFHNQVVRVVIDPAPEPGPVADLMDELKSGYACVDFA
jgi:hypothetical protein